MADQNEKNLNADDALRFLAGGGEIKDESQVEGPSASQVAGELADAETIEAGAFVPAAAPGARPGAPSAYAPTRVRAESFSRQARGVHSTQFKRMMIPLLVVVGALLLVMGILIMSIIAMRNPAISSNDFFSQYGWMFVCLAIPMGLILLGGAWMFWKDLAAQEKRLRLSQQKRAVANSYEQQKPPPQRQRNP